MSTSAMIVLGIDPGRTGGIAAMDSHGHARAWDMPDDLPSLAAFLRDFNAKEHPGLAMVEQVNCDPRFGAKGNFTFGGWSQGVLCVLYTLEIPTRTVLPRAWQKAILGGGREDTKSKSLRLARAAYPTVDLHRKADHGKADALHLARFGVLDSRSDAAGG